jgi:hypothetical protein
MSKCSRCKSSKVEWSYFVEVKGKTKDYLKKVNLCNPCHQNDCVKSRNALRDSFNAMFTCNGVDRELVKIAMSSKEY